MVHRPKELGIILIALGVLIFIAQEFKVGSQEVVAAIGIAFLVAYAATKHYGFLVPGGIMTGLGLGILYQRRFGGGAAVLIGLGLGFLGIYAISVMGRDRPGGWWPLIPGLILLAIGVLNAAGQAGLLGTLGRAWPLVVIILGVYLVVRPRRVESKS